MKILFLVESLDVGGTELSLLKWLRHCDRGKFEPSIISFRKGGLMKELEALNVHTTIIHKRFPFDISFFYRLIRNLEKIKPDVVHCRNGIPAISYGVIAARIAGIPVVSSIHGRTHYLKHNVKTWIWFKIMRLNHKIITVTQDIRQDVIRYSGMDPQRVTVIYNGIDISANHSALTSKENLRSEYGLGINDFVLGTVGNLRSIKGHKYLIEAMPDIIKSQLNARLVLVGQGTEEENLKKLAEKLQIKDRVIFLGYQENAGRLIHMFDIFVLPSLSEGFPNVLLEAMMAKTPIIASKVGGVEEILDDGKTGLLIKSQSASAIAQQAIRLAAATDLRQKIAENAFQKAQKCFDMANMLAHYDMEYKRLAMRHGNTEGETIGKTRH